jgi:hypothetical protein
VNNATGSDVVDVIDADDMIGANVEILMRRNAAAATTTSASFNQTLRGKPSYDLY